MGCIFWLTPSTLKFWRTIGRYASFPVAFITCCRSSSSIVIVGCCFMIVSLLVCYLYTTYGNTFNIQMERRDKNLLSLSHNNNKETKIDRRIASAERRGKDIAATIVEFSYRILYFQISSEFICVRCFLGRLSSSTSFIDPGSFRNHVSPLSPSPMKPEPSRTPKSLQKVTI